MGNTFRRTDLYQPTREEILHGFREYYKTNNVQYIYLYTLWGYYDLPGYLWVPTSITDPTLIERKFTLRFKNHIELTEFVRYINKPYTIDYGHNTPHVYINFIQNRDASYNNPTYAIAQAKPVKKPTYATAQAKSVKAKQTKPKKTIVIP